MENQANDLIADLEDSKKDLLKEKELKEKTDIIANEVKDNSNPNMALWNEVCTTDPAMTKRMQYGPKLTSIDAQYQLKEATKVFGSFGHKWGVKDEYFNFHSNDTNTCLYTAILFYSDGEIPIHSDIEVYKDKRYVKDWSKKVATDALTKGLSKLGFNSDVFEGKFDDSKYVDSLKGNVEKAFMTVAMDKKTALTPIPATFKEILYLYYENEQNVELKQNINNQLEASENSQKAFVKMLDGKYPHLNYGGNK